MKNTFIKPDITVELFDIDVVTTSGNYDGYQRVIDSLATEELSASAEKVDWLAVE